MVLVGKSEPDAWSWNDHVKAGVAEWDRVRNHQANNNIKLMREGDELFYHSVSEKLIVGVLEVVKEHYLDPTDEAGRFGMVDFKALFPVKKPVSLSQIKAEPRLLELALIRQSRLSVVQVSTHWRVLSAMAGVRPKRERISGELDFMVKHIFCNIADLVEGKTWGLVK